MYGQFRTSQWDGSVWRRRSALHGLSGTGQKVGTACRCRGPRTGWPVLTPLPPLRLLAPRSEVRSDLQQLFPCELVVGMNGRLWVKSSSVQQTLVIANLLQSCDTMTDQQRRQLFKRVAQGAL